MKLYKWSRWQCTKYRLEQKGVFKFVTPEGHQRSVNRREKLKKAWKWLREHITFAGIFTVVATFTLTGVLMVQGYVERGEFCIGGECLIPPAVLLYWLVMREVDK